MGGEERWPLSWLLKYSSASSLRFCKPHIKAFSPTLTLEEVAKAIIPVSKGQGEDSAPLSDLALPCMAPHLPALTPWFTFPHQNRMGGRSREQGWSVEASLRAIEPKHIWGGAR